jgi:N-acetylglucosaminyldiphosphoundecaprenol N-acetyl-beta-D-mannosaminyltransferase
MINGLLEKTETLVSPRCRVLGVRFDLIDYQAAFGIIEAWRRQQARQYVTLANPRDVRACVRDRGFREATARSGLTLPDGVGIVLAARILVYGNRGRVTGPTLMLKVCDWGRQYNYRHYFYGGKEGVPERLRRRLSGKYPGLRVVGTYSPPFRALSQEEDQAVVTMINSTRPDVVWVGLGAPKQEKWMADHRGRIEAPVMIGVGAAFDFHSGNCRWAPSWIRKVGGEWAWRLLLEPRRMWRRNLDGVVFLAQVIHDRLRTASRWIDMPCVATPPAPEDAGRPAHNWTSPTSFPSPGRSAAGSTVSTEGAEKETFFQESRRSRLALR